MTPESVLVVDALPCPRATFVVTTEDVGLLSDVLGDYTPPASTPSEGGDLTVFVADAINADERLGG